MNPSRQSNLAVLASVVLLGLASQTQAEFQCYECIRGTSPNISRTIDTCGDNLELAKKKECQAFEGFSGCFKIEVWDGVFVGTGEDILFDQVEIYTCLDSSKLRRKRSLEEEIEEFDLAFKAGECYELKPTLLEAMTPMMKFSSIQKARVCSCLAGNDDGSICTP